MAGADLRTVNRFSEYLDGRMTGRSVAPAGGVASTEGVQPNPVSPPLAGRLSSFLDDRMGVSRAPAEVEPAQSVSTPESEWSHLGKAFKLGEASIQQQTGQFTKDLSAVLERNLGPYQDRIRQMMGLDVAMDAQERARQIEQTQSTPQILAEKTLTELQGFRTMTTDDVHGVLSGVQYAMEQVAASAPAMLPVMATGALGVPLNLAMQAGQVNSELAQKLPNMTPEQRTSVSVGAGLATSSLDFLGMGAVFGKLGPSQVAEMAAMKTLANYMTRQGLAPATARLVQAAIAEGTTEALQEAINVAAVEMSGGAMTPGEITSRLRESFFGGAAAGGVMRAPVEVLGGGGTGESNEAPAGETADQYEAKMDLSSFTDDDLGTSEGGVPQLPAPTGGAPVLALPSPEMVAAGEGKVFPDGGTAGGENGPISSTIPSENPLQTLPNAVPPVSPALSEPSTPLGPISTAQTLGPDVTETLEDVGVKAPEGVELTPNPIDMATLPDAPVKAMTSTAFAPESNDNPILSSIDASERAIWNQIPKQMGIDPESLGGSPRVFEVYKAIRSMVMKHVSRGTISDESFHRVMNAITYQTLAQGASPEFTQYLRNQLQRSDNYDLGRLTKLAMEAQAYNELRSDLDKVGLTQTKLTFNNAIGSSGKYYRGPDAISIRIDDEQGVTIGHEAIHALKHLGAFDTGLGKQAWDVLVNYVNTLPDSVIVSQNQYKPEMYIEEKIAELYGQYNNVRNAKLKYAQWKVPGTVKEALELIRKGFEVVKSWADKYAGKLGEIKEIKKPWEALEAIASGKITPQMKAIGGEEFARLQAITSAIPRLGKAKNTKALQNGVDYYGFNVKWGWTVIQVAKKNPHISWLQTYVQQANRWFNEKMSWTSRADETVYMWNNLGLKQQNALSAAIWEIDAMTYRSPAEVKAKVQRLPTRAELVTIFQKHGLNQKSAAVYMKVKKDFDAVLAKMEQVAIRDATRVLANTPGALSLQIAQINSEFKKLRSKPFFPHARFGDYTAVVKNKQTGKTIYLEAFDTSRARDAALSNIRKQFANNPDAVVSASMFPQEVRIFKQLPQSFLIALKHTLNLTPQQEAELNDMLVAASSMNTFKAQSNKVTTNLEGYSRDAMRAYADYFWHGSNHIARVVYGPEMEGAIREAERDIEAKQLSGIDSTTRVQISDYLRHHLDNIMNPKPDWNSLRSVGFLMYLGYNVKSAVMNFTQVPMVTYPHLAAQFGDVGTVRALTDTYTRLRKLYASPKNFQRMLTPQDAKLFAIGVEHGIFNESMAQQLAGIAEGGNLLRTRAGSSAHKMLLKGQEMAGLMFQLTEKLNRKVTFFATLDLAKRNPNAKYLQQIRQEYPLELQDLINGVYKLTPEEATAFLAAKDSVRATQFEYGQWARPRFMEGRASAFFTFFMFTQHMLWFARHNPGNTRYLLILLGSAGLLGLPFADDLNEFAKFVGRNIFGKEWNLEKEIRDVLVDFTDAPPDLFIHGVSRYGFGLKHLGEMTGVPLPAVDMSGNLGMGSPMPVISPLVQALGRQGDFNDKLSEFTQEGVGATFGIGLNILKALSEDESNPRRWEQAMPTAIANISKAYTQWQDEELKMRGGAQLIPFDRNDPEHMAELVAQGLGFTLTRASQAWDRRIADIEAGEFWMTSRGILLRQLDHAKQGGDERDVKDVNDAIHRYNAEVPFPELKLSPKTIARSMRAREATRKRREAGRPDAKYLAPVYKELERLYPELEQDTSEGVEPAPRG